MSWDVCLKLETVECPSCGQSTTEYCTEIGNMTYNVSPMYYRALGFAWKQFNDEEYLRGDGGKWFGLCQLDGMKCSDAIPYILVALAHMNQNPEEYRKMNPENGWGSYETALEFLGKLKEESLKHMNAVIEVC